MIKVRNELGECPCYICDFACSTKQRLAHHTSTVHNTPESLICTHCKAKLRDVSSVRRHIKTVHLNGRDYMCTYCDKQYKHKFDLEKHFTKVHKSWLSTQGENYCSECKLQCLGWEHLKRHYLDAHGKTINHIKCPQCYKIFFDVSYLKQHFKKVHNNKAFAVVYCKHCGSVMETELQLVKHIQEIHPDVVDHEEEGDVEEVRDDSFHLSSPIHSESSRSGTKKARLSYTKYRCTDEIQCVVEECKDLLVSKMQLVVHLMEHHRWKSVMECQKCLALFPSTTEVQEHLNSHFLEPDDSPLLPSGKQSILKKRLLKRRCIKDLSIEMEPYRYFLGLSAAAEEEEGERGHSSTMEREVEVVTNLYQEDQYSRFEPKRTFPPPPPALPQSTSPGFTSGKAGYVYGVPEDE